ncbi:MAG: CDP-alcohol phosphatidyltransferase family protein [Ilumatobacteraceae bacterium]
MSAKTSTETPVLRHPVAKGWFVHSFTALGALCGMFGLMAVQDRNYKAAILWLAIAMVVDGLDGLAARRFEVKTHVPRIDGYTLDLIIDFVTCIVIPVMFMLRFRMLPNGPWGAIVASFVMLMSALWMSRTDQMTSDHFFNGFPCEWNMIVPTLFLLDMRPVPTAIACILLGLTQLTNWKFLHPMQVRKFRPLTITVTVVWLATVLLMTADLPIHNAAAKLLLVACPLYIVGLGVWRTLTGPPGGGEEPAMPSTMRP